MLIIALQPELQQTEEDFVRDHVDASIAPMCMPWISIFFALHSYCLPVTAGGTEDAVKDDAATLTDRLLCANLLNNLS